MTARQVVFVLFPGFQILDLTGPHEVFLQAGYQVETVAAQDGPVASKGGLAVVPSRSIRDHTGPVDTLMVVGGQGTDAACQDDELVAWITSAAQRARRTAAVCSGAFLLARAGLLDGRRAVTHWARCDGLAARHPEVTVDPDALFVKDGQVWTSAGVTAGIDLALAMVEEDHGPDLTRRIARYLVMFVQRPGGQAQFSTQLAAQRPTTPRLREVQDWIVANPAEELGVPSLAERAAMSERHFTRLFAAQTGRTPAAYVEAVRIEAARRLLETTSTTLDGIARACGFGTVETMHRSFRRALGITPGQYRHHFTAA